MRLFKRGRVWWCWYFEDGKRHLRSTKCRDQKAAELVARNWERDAADPHHAAARTATLSAALTLLLKDRQEQARAGRRSDVRQRDPGDHAPKLYLGSRSTMRDAGQGDHRPRAS